MSLLKLMKLMYMAEKLSYHRYGDPLIGDAPFSLKDGPILSGVYDRAKGQAPKGSIWGDFFQPRNRNEVSLATATLGVDSLGSLSDADIDVLDSIWRKFGHMTARELRNYSHNFPEWDNPLKAQKKQIAIKLERMLVGIGFKPEEAADKQRELSAQARTLQVLCTSE